jgi:hypothetical protein
MDNQWLVIETLGADEPFTVIADGGQRKYWSSLSRARSSYGPSIATDSVAVVRACVASADIAELSTKARRGGGDVRIVGVPVLGAYGAVHAVHLWVGPADADPPPRRRVAGWDWYVEQLFCVQGPNLEEWFIDRDPRDVKTIRTAAENFKPIVRFDDRMGYMKLVADVDGEWQGEITLLGDDGVRRTLQMVARANTGTENPLIRGLFHEITDVRPPEPQLDRVALDAVANLLPAPAGMLDLGKRLIYDWVSPPPPPLECWMRDLAEFHTDDRATYDTACDRLIAGSDRETLTFRVRFPETDWIVTDAVLTILTREHAPQALIQVSAR